MLGYFKKLLIGLQPTPTDSVAVSDFKVKSNQKTMDCIEDYIVLLANRKQGEN